MVPSVPVEPGSAPPAFTVALLKAQLQSMQSDNAGALECVGQLANFPEHQHDDHAAATVYFNNLGFLLLRMKKPSGAAFYFTKALTASEKVRKRCLVVVFSLSLLNSSAFFRRLETVLPVLVCFLC